MARRQYEQLMSGERIYYGDDALYGDDVDAMLGEVDVDPDARTEHMSDREFTKYIDRLFEVWAGESL